MKAVSSRRLPAHPLALPNLLTYARIIAVPVVVGLLFWQSIFDGALWLRWVALAIFIAAGVTDILDGYFARMWGQQSSLGRMLDPIADKLIVSAALLMLAAAVALRSLQGLDAALASRRQYAERLRRVLTEDCAEAFAVQRIPDGVQSNFQNLGVLCRRQGRRDVTMVQAELGAAGIETRRYFWPPLHQLPAYRGRFSLPITDEIGDAILCLPLHSWMEPSMLDRITAALRQTASRANT